MGSIGLSLNAWIEKFMFLIIPFIIVGGYLFSKPLSGFVYLIPYLFAFVTISMAIGCSLEQIKAVFARPVAISIFLIMIHVVASIIAYLLGTLIFGAGSPYIVGLVMYTLIPVGVSSVIWVGIAGGQLSLVLSLVVIDSLLSPIVVTSGIKLFFNEVVEVNTRGMIIDLLLIVVLPTIVGITIYELSKGKFQPKVKPLFAPLSKFCFLTVIALNVAAIAPSYDQLKHDMIKIIPVSITIVIISYGLGYLTVLHKKQLSLSVTMAYASGVRNVSLGIVLTMSYFSPQTAIPVLIAVLLQQPLATLHNFALQKINKRTYSQMTGRTVR